MRTSTIDLLGQNDPVLCDCCQELTQLETLDLGAAARAAIFDQFFYIIEERPTSIEQEMEGVRIESFAVPASMGTRTIHASADCSTCQIRLIYAIEFDGNQVVSMDLVRG